MEQGEGRSDSGSDPRIVRVGAHALKEGSGTKFWTRLSQHRGQERTSRYAGAGGGEFQSLLILTWHQKDTSTRGRTIHDVNSSASAENCGRRRNGDLYADLSTVPNDVTGP